MPDGINIPGVSDRYKTNDLVESLMEVERVPLEREQSNLDAYRKEEDAWRGVNQKMSSLRDSVKALYSYENPFNSKVVSSSEEDAITADADRNADFTTFRIDVLETASADRFLSDEIDSSYQVPEGRYTFSVGKSRVDFNFRGGSLDDFVSALNKRGGNTIHARVINVTHDSQSLLLESLLTGADARLTAENDALTFAKDVGIFQEAENTSSDSEKGGLQNITVAPHGDFEMALGDGGGGESRILEFEFTRTDDIKDESPSQAIQNTASRSSQAGASEGNAPSGEITFEGISISNNPSDSTLPPGSYDTIQPFGGVGQSGSNEIFYIVDSNGNETPVDSTTFTSDNDGKVRASINLEDYPDAAAFVVRNASDASRITMSEPVLHSSLDTLEASAAQDETGSGALSPYTARHAVSNARDAKIKYEGITMTRPSNDIDDIIPNVTLHLHKSTDGSATITCDPDIESVKDAIVTFVGRYNQAIAEMNILSTDKEEVITELDYLTSDEQDAAEERLGMLRGDFSLTNVKSSLQTIVSSNYGTGRIISMLSQIGVSTNASGTSGRSSPAQMRGYLEINESRLDDALKSNLSDVKNLFGFDSDGDLVIDEGIAYAIDRVLTSWVQSGGIISTKTATLENQIDSSTSKIERLQTQLDQRESELRQRYANMEGTLNSLESQQTTMQNFTRQNQRSD